MKLKAITESFYVSSSPGDSGGYDSENSLVQLVSINGPKIRFAQEISEYPEVEVVSLLKKTMDRNGFGKFVVVNDEIPDVVRLALDQLFYDGEIKPAGDGVTFFFKRQAPVGKLPSRMVVTNEFFGRAHVLIEDLLNCCQTWEEKFKADIDWNVVNWAFHSACSWFASEIQTSVFSLNEILNNKLPYSFFAVDDKGQTGYSVEEFMAHFAAGDKRIMRNRAKWYGNTDLSSRAQLPPKLVDHPLVKGGIDEIWTLYQEVRTEMLTKGKLLQQWALAHRGN